MKRFESIINIGIKEAMSDVYITGGHPLVTRKAGTIGFHNTIVWSHQEVDNLVMNLLTEKQLESLRERKSVDYAISFSNARLRINFFTTTRGMSLAIRILPGVIPTIEELNLHPSLHDIAKLQNGLVLVCGPTGVGKTTTIAAIINDINTTQQLHIVMLENPVEYRFQSKKSFIQQRELGIHMPSFTRGILDVLRENPDVIVVGELREPETMQLALTAAESGHLVIATMHASSPEEAVHRLCNAVPIESQNEIRYQLSFALQTIIIQSLVHLEKLRFRVPLLTIVRGTPSIRNLIRENKLSQITSAIQMSKTEGMFTPERYFDEYLEGRRNFTPYSQIFRASVEETTDILYSSPLTTDKQDLAPAGLKKRPLRGSEPIVIRTDYSGQEAEHLLTIDEDESLQDLLKKLNK
jgi:twitching motility protein PilT